MEDVRGAALALRERQGARAWCAFGGATHASVQVASRPCGIGRRNGHLPAAAPLATDNQWQAVRDGFGPPDLVIASPEYTMPAQHQDMWWRPMIDIPVTEPRWVRMVEIRPTNMKARKIVHHAIAYHVLSPDNVAATRCGPRS